MLSWTEYQRLLQTMEDLEDSLDLKRAIRTAKQFVSHETVVKALQRRTRR